MRADARENRERILLAARHVFANQGPDAPLEDIARRANVGIATLYRRFPDRQALMRAVALDVWRRATHEAQAALAEEPDPLAALARHMHRALDLRVAAVMPILAVQLSMQDGEMRQVRDESAEAMQRLVDRARAEGVLRPDVTSGDIGLLLVRLGRPYVTPFPHDLDDRLAHRQLDLLIDGLRHLSSHPAVRLPGPAVTLADLVAFSSAGDSATGLPGAGADPSGPREAGERRTTIADDDDHMPRSNR